MRKNQAIRLYLFIASAKIPQRFSSRRRLLLHHTRNKKDTASILCRVQRMPSMASAEHEFACRKLTALTGGQWFTAKSSLQCKLEVKECTGRTFFNDDIRGGSEQNSKQPNVHPCTFGCDAFRGGSELAFLSIKTDNKCSEPYDDFSLIHLENPIRQNLS